MCNSKSLGKRYGKCLWERFEKRSEFSRGDNIKCFSHEASTMYDNFMELFINSYHNP